MPFARAGTADELVDALDAEGFEVLALSPTGDEALERVARRPRTALLVGSEGPGLPESILRRTRTVRIEMAPGFDSLNVATAAAIALHRLAGLDRTPRETSDDAADA
jgi:tRNA G18 (ribose-2'-O)-methylase SpoU